MKKIFLLLLFCLNVLNIVHAEPSLNPSSQDEFAVFENSIMGPRFRITNTDPKIIAQWLITNRAYKQKGVIMDGGYQIQISIPGKETQYFISGTPEFDQWIEHNR